MNTSSKYGQVMEAERVKNMHACAGQRWRGQRDFREGFAEIECNSLCLRALDLGSGSALESVLNPATY